MKKIRVRKFRIGQMFKVNDGGDFNFTGVIVAIEPAGKGNSQVHYKVLKGAHFDDIYLFETGSQWAHNMVKVIGKVSKTAKVLYE